MEKLLEALLAFCISMSRHTTGLVAADKEIVVCHEDDYECIEDAIEKDKAIATIGFRG